MPENQEKPIEDGGLIEPGRPAQSIARVVVEKVQTAPEELPAAAKEPATKDVVPDTAMVAPVTVPEPAVVVTATEGETKEPAAAAAIRRFCSVRTRMLIVVCSPLDPAAVGRHAGQEPTGAGQPVTDRQRLNLTPLDARTPDRGPGVESLVTCCHFHHRPEKAGSGASPRRSLPTGVAGVRTPQRGKLSRALTPAELAEAIDNHGMSAVGAAAAIVSLLIDDGTQLELVRVVGLKEDVLNA